MLAIEREPTGGTADPDRIAPDRNPTGHSSPAIDPFRHVGDHVVRAASPGCKARLERIQLGSRREDVG